MIFIFMKLNLKSQITRILDIHSILYYNNTMHHPHHPLHHHFEHPSHWMNLFGYVAYAILVLGVSLVIAALAFEGKHSAKAPTPTPIAMTAAPTSEPAHH